MLTIRRRMGYKKIKFSKLDFWVRNPYPNPNFNTKNPSPIFQAQTSDFTQNHKMLINVHVVFKKKIFQKIYKFLLK